MKWLIKLNGDNGILETLCQADYTDDFYFEKSIDEFLLNSSQFSDCQTNSEVIRIASDFIETLNGMIFFQYSIPAAIQIGHVYKINENGGRDTFIMVGTARMELRSYEPTITITKNTGETKVIKPGQKIFEKLPKVQSSLKAKKIFRLIQNGDFEFADMYKIVEIILSEKGSKIYEWVAESKINLLKRTANHDQAIGDKARHGVMNTEAPKKPMDLEEARSITRILIEKYINEVVTE